jgi:hypothetical protein
MKKLLSTFSALFLLVMTTISVNAASTNLVSNGGFETLGSYIGNGLYNATDWTISDLSSGTGVYSTVSSSGYGSLGLLPAEGQSFLWGGAYSGNTGTITQQTLTSTARMNYNLDFSLANTNNGYSAANSWLVKWNGVNMGSGTNVGNFGNTPYHFVVTGTGNDTLQFVFNNEPGAFALDKVSVSATPIPAAAWLLGSGLIGLIGIKRRNQKHPAGETHSLA